MRDRRGKPTARYERGLVAKSPTTTPKGGGHAQIIKTTLTLMDILDGF
ncbi:MAG: hypothetical protein U0V04_13045 [Spirosomataceae bacterium]